jgi:hypothetical protein
MGAVFNFHLAAHCNYLQTMASKLWLPNMDSEWLMTDNDGINWFKYDAIPNHLGINLLLPKEPNLVDGKR